MRPRTCLLAGAAAVVALVGPLSACASNGSQPVYQVMTGVFVRWPYTTADIIDLGLPALINQTSQPVQLRWVTPVDWPTAIHLQSITAYNYYQAGFGISGSYGDLPKLCPRQFVPHPLAVVVTAPHQQSNWFVVFALTISRPGRYHLNQVKIGYTTGGHQGWQYQNLDTELVITRASRPTIIGNFCSRP